MECSRKGASRYNKVNQQKKFHLLTLIYKRHLPVREVTPFPCRPHKSLASTTSQPRPSSSSTKITTKLTNSTSTTLTNTERLTIVSRPRLLRLKERIQYRKNWITPRAESRWFAPSAIFSVLRPPSPKGRVLRKCVSMQTKGSSNKQPSPWDPPQRPRCSPCRQKCARLAITPFFWEPPAAKGRNRWKVWPWRWRDGQN